MRRSAASSSGPVQLDAHGSTIVREKSVTPRLRMASCQRGSACTISSQAMNSSAMIGACTPGDRFPGHHRLVGERDHRLVRGALAPLVHDEVRLPRQRGAVGRPGQQLGLGRLLQRDEDEPRAGSQVLPFAQQGRRGGDLVARERFQGVGCGGDGRVLDGGHAWAPVVSVVRWGSGESLSSNCPMRA